jgi:hypothetical protein
MEGFKMKVLILDETQINFVNSLLDKKLDNANKDKRDFINVLKESFKEEINTHEEKLAAIKFILEIVE